MDAERTMQQGWVRKSPPMPTRRLPQDRSGRTLDDPDRAPVGVDGAAIRRTTPVALNSAPRKGPVAAADIYHGAQVLA